MRGAIKHTENTDNHLQLHKYVAIIEKDTSRKNRNFIHFFREKSWYFMNTSNFRYQFSWKKS